MMLSRKVIGLEDNPYTKSKINRLFYCLILALLPILILLYPRLSPSHPIFLEALSPTEVPVLIDFNDFNGISSYQIDDPILEELETVYQNEIILGGMDYFPDAQAIFFFRQDINPETQSGTNFIQLINDESRALARQTNNPRYDAILNKLIREYYYPLQIDNSIDQWQINIYNQQEDVISSHPSAHKPLYLNVQGNMVQDQNQSTQTVRGLVASIHFPAIFQRQYAEIIPAYPIIAFDPQGLITNENNGLLNNVGDIQEIRVHCSGLNMNNKIAIRLQDQDGNIHEYDLGFLSREQMESSPGTLPIITLRWVSGNYRREIPAQDFFNINREEIENQASYQGVLYPWEIRFPRTYPYEVKFLTFHSFIIYSSLDTLGKEFSFIVKDIQVRYTYHMLPSRLQHDIEDDEIWTIMKDVGRKRYEASIWNMIREIYYHSKLNYFNQHG